MEGVEVKVAEAKAGDVGRGIARIDPKIFREMGFVTGDILQILGKNRTAVVLWPGYPEDTGFKIVRIDGPTRRNAGVGIDDKVRARKISAREATRVVLAPTEPLRIVGGEIYLRQLLENRVVTKGDLIEISVMGRKIGLVATALQPPGDAAIINPRTQVEISEKPASEVLEKKIPRITYEDIGGLQDEVQKIREMIELPLKHPEIFERLGVEAPKGVLLHGPPGTGKTLLAKAVANETEAQFLSIGGPEIMSKFYGESEERLRELFKEAEENAPSILFIDEIDSIAPKREEVTGEVERRVVAQLLAKMDGLTSRGQVVVIGATNRPDALDPALRRPGRFDREIEIGVPDRGERLEILQIHTRGMPLSEDVDLPRLADISHGFVGADLAALTKEAAMRALRRILPEIDLEAPSVPVEILNKITVSQNDFMDAFMETEPSALREVLVEIPDVRWSDVGGLQEVKEKLQEAVEWPLKYPDLFDHLKAQPPKGVLLHGPPGTGKTLLAKAVANESEANFILVKGPEFLSKWVGESEKAVRETFRKARQAAPCIVFFDELDSLTPMRGRGADSSVTERVISQLLNELDGLEELRGVVVIGATNRPDLIDPALLRPGRFDRLLFIPPPDQKARQEILQIHTQGKPLDKGVSLPDLAARTEGFTGAALAALANEAVMEAIREYVKEGKPLVREEIQRDLVLEKRHFEEALRHLKVLSQREVRRYTEISERFLRDLEGREGEE
jgi:transitional endoplasmic reticulum ATPase